MYVPAWPEWTDNATLNRYREGRKVNAAAEKLTYLTIFYNDVLTEIATNRYKWENLPDNIPQRFIERELHSQGLVVFFHDTTYQKFFALRGAPIGRPNVYDNPTLFEAYGNGIMRRELAYAQADGLKECVPIWANYNRIPTTRLIAIYAQRLANIDITIDQNVIAARTPIMYTGDPNADLSAVQLNRQIKDGVDFIRIGQTLESDTKVFNTGLDPKIFETVHALRAKVFNECMGLLGIDNANQDKAERLVEGEVDANEDQVVVTRAGTLSSRELAVEELNTRYNLDVSVEYIGISDPSGTFSELIGKGV